jgi:hypothetical protein
MEGSPSFVMTVEGTSIAKRLFEATFDLTASRDIINVKSAIKRFLINRCVHVLEYYSLGIFPAPPTDL